METKPFHFKGTKTGHIVYAGNIPVAEITDAGINFNKYPAENFYFSMADLKTLIQQYNDNYKWTRK